MARKTLLFLTAVVIGASMSLGAIAQASPSTTVKSSDNAVKIAGLLFQPEAGKKAEEGPD